MQEIKNTKNLQLSSLKSFMREIGYDFYPLHGVFTSDFDIHKGRKTLSFNKAVLLYNGHYNDCHGNPWFEYPFETIPYEYFISAEKAKLVSQVKLQYSKKKGIVVQSNIVELIDKALYALFLQ